MKEHIGVYLIIFILLTIKWALGGEYKRGIGLDGEYKRGIGYQYVPLAALTVWIMLEALYLVILFCFIK